MKAERIFTLDGVSRILPLEKEIQNKRRDNVSEEDLIRIVATQIINPLFGFWIISDKDRITGYFMGLMSLAPHKRLYILRVYAKDKETKKKVKRIIKSWASLFNVDNMQITVKSKVRLFQRLKWKVTSVDMEKQIWE